MNNISSYYKLPLLCLPIAVDYAAQKIYKKDLPFSKLIRSLPGPATLVLSSRFLSQGKCLLMTVMFVAYKLWRYNSAQVPNLPFVRSTATKPNASQPKQDASAKLAAKQKVENTLLRGGLYNEVQISLFEHQLNLIGIPEKLSWFSESLETLFLGKNELTELTLEDVNVLKGLTCLKKLDLSHNKLSSLPKELVKLSSKCTIYLVSNPLTSQAIRNLNGWIEEERESSNGTQGPNIVLV